MIRNAARRSIRRLGYDVRRYLPTTTPEARLARLLASFGIDLVLDVGANTGQYGQSLREIGYRGRIVSFEPLSSAAAQLALASAGDDGWIVADRAAIGDRNGSIALNVSGNSVSSSVLPMLAAHRDAAPESAYIGSETVPLLRLDVAALQYTAGAASILLKIDTQGYEAAVLAGADETLERTAVVQLEMSLVPLYDGQALFDDLHATMLQRGFSLWSLWPGFSDPVSGQLLQVDGFYARSARSSGQRT